MRGGGEGWTTKKNNFFEKSEKRMTPKLEGRGLGP